MIEILLKSVVILGMTGAVCLLCGRAPAAWRHRIWTAAVAGVLVLLVAAPVLDRMGTAWSREIPFGLRPPAWVVEPRIGWVIPDARDRAPGRDSDAAPSSSPPARTSGQPGRPESAGAAIPPLAILCVWAAGALLVLGRLAAGHLALAGLRRRITPLRDAEWLLARDELCEEYRLARRPHLYRSADVTTSMTWGVFDAAIVLPESASDWPESRRRMVLAHELAHVKRRDLFWNLLARIACAVYWMNPLVWIAARRLRSEAEFACDDMVLVSGVERAEYAQLLVEAARCSYERGRRHIVAVGMAGKSRLGHRVRAILDPTRPRSRSGRVMTSAAFAVMLAAVLSIAAFESTAGTPTTRVDAGRPTVESGVRAVVSGPCEQDRWQSLRAPDPEATRAAIALLRNGTETARAEAADRLGSVGTKDAVPVLIEVLEDSDEHLRAEASTSLGHLGDRRAIDPLLLALSDPNKHVRQAAAGALGALRDPIATLPLAALLQSPDDQLRQAAASALGDAGDRRGVGPLILALSDPDEHVRQSAAISLGRMGAERASGSLVVLLDDDYPHVRAAAIRALGQLGVREHVDRLASAYDRGGNPFEVLEAARALGQLGDFRGVGLLVATLRDAPEQFIRRDAAWGIAAIAGTSETHRRRLVLHSGRVEDALRGALHDRSVFVRQAAGCALEKLSGVSPD